VRFPWFDQMTAFYGEERLAALRADQSPWRMVRAAIVHAVLQAETAIVDLLREPPATPTHVLLVALVAVNRRDQDTALPVGVHHLVFEGGAARFEHGASLRSTPAALQLEEKGGRLRVSSPHDSDGHPAREARRAELVLPPAVLARAEAEDLAAHLASARGQLRSLHARKAALRVYARPILRAFLQVLSMVAPEVGLAALALEEGRELRRAAHLWKLLEQGPSTVEARRALHDLEPTIEQLSQREAREVLERLLAEQHPLLGRRSRRPGSAGSKDDPSAAPGSQNP
jgi:hypothetical protein